MTLFTQRRASKREWRVAARLVSDELLRMMENMRFVIRTSTPPPREIMGEFLRTQSWGQYQAVIARELPDNERGTLAWYGLARVTSVSRTIHSLIASVPPDTSLGSDLLDLLRAGFTTAWESYEALTGQPPPTSPLEPPAAAPPEGDAG
jgi:hypothetical protein